MMEDDRHRRIDEIVLQHAAARGGRETILEEGGEGWTGHEVVETVADIRSHLSAMGVAATDRVIVSMASAGRELLAVVAVMGGAVAVPAPSDASATVARRHVRTSGATHLVTDGTTGPVRDAAEEAGLTVVSLEAGARTDAGASEAWAGATVDDVAVVLLTSGSTAEPKAVPVRHRAFTRTTGATAQVLDLGPGTRTIVAQPLTHVSGLSSGSLLGLRAGGSVVLLARFDPERLLDALERTQPTVFTGTPSMHQAVIRSARRRGLVDFGRLRWVRTGGGRLDGDVAERLRRGYGTAQLLSSYGMSEALQVTQVPPGDWRDGSVGPSIGPELRIVDEHGPVPTGLTGIVELRGPTVFAGYDGEGPGPDPDGWFRSGDRGHLDADGWLYIEGRIDDVVLRGGQNVPLAAVEQGLRAFGGVEAAIAAGVPHPLLGHDIGAVVAAPPDLDVAALRGHMHELLGAPFVPTTVVVVESVPQTRTGKEDRRAAAALLQKAAEGAVAGSGGPPVGSLEQLVSTQVRDVLDRNDLGRDDDLFAFGATSLDIAALAELLGEALDRVVHVTAIVGHPTIRTLASRLVPPTVRPAPRDGDLAARAATLPPVGPMLRDETRLDVAPVFVLSPPRSGSTLLRAMLAGHPELFAPPELRLLWFSSMQAWAAGHSGPRSSLREGLLRAVMGARDCTLDEARDVVETWVADDLPVGDVYAALAGWVAPRRLVDKSPLMALDPTALQRAEELFAAPAYIHLVRDPRTSSVSFERAGIDQLWSTPFDGSPRDLGWAAWQQAHTNILDFLEEVPWSRQQRVLLTALTAAPVETMRALLARIGLAYVPEVIRPHDDPGARMTDGVVPEARMVGDPRFWSRTRIEPVDREIEGVVPADIAPLMGRLGLPSGSTDEVVERVVTLQCRMLGEWDERVGDWSHPVAPGPLAPLHWIMQNPRELAAVRASAPEGASINAMRSMHLLGREPAVMEALAGLYADEIAAGQPDGAIHLGGNCQGGMLAHLVARRLRARGREIGLLWMLDFELREPWDGPLLLLFGEESTSFNPRLKLPDSRPLLDDLHPQLQMAEVPSGHGQFFEAATMPVVMERILAAAEAAGRR